MQAFVGERVRGRVSIPETENRMLRVGDTVHGFAMCCYPESKYGAPIRFGLRLKILHDLIKLQFHNSQG